MLMSCLLMGAVAFMSLYPYDLLEVNSQPYLVNSTPLSAGDKISYHVDFCKNTTKSAVIKRILQGEGVHFLEDAYPSFPKGCYSIDIGKSSSSEGVLLIPEGLPKGVYTYKEVVIYKPNVLRTIEYVFESEPFEVI